MDSAHWLALATAVALYAGQSPHVNAAEADPVKAVERVLQDVEKGKPPDTQAQWWSGAALAQRTFRADWESLDTAERGGLGAIVSALGARSFNA